MNILLKALESSDHQSYWMNNLRFITETSAANCVDLNSVNVINKDLILIGEPRTGLNIFLTRKTVLTAKLVWVIESDNLNDEGQTKIKEYLSTTKAPISSKGDIKSSFLFNAFDIEREQFLGDVPIFTVHNMTKQSKLLVFNSKQQAKQYMRWHA